VRVWDVVLSIVLLIALGVLAALTSMFGAFLAMASDPCGVRDCSAGLIGAGMLTAMILPWLLLVAAVILVIVLLVRRRLAFWVSLAAAPLIIGSWFLGAVIASAGVPGSSL
jgi:uncharacterized BrkB/YihY/UPF0761 family membrane protein